MVLKKTFFKQVSCAVWGGVIGLSCVSYVQATSLEEAVATSFNTNPQLREYFHKYKERAEDLKIAEAGWLPSVDLTAAIATGEQDTPQSRLGLVEEEIQPLNYGITLTQVLFDGFFTSENISRVKNETQSEFYQLQVAAENLALDVVKVYLDVLQKQKLIELAQKNLESHRQIHQQIKMRTDNGLGSASDLSQVTGRLARANANYLTAENNLLDAQASFFRLVGQSPKELKLPVADMDLLPISKSSLITDSLQKHQTILLAKSDIRAVKAEFNANSSSYYPRVTFDVGYNTVDDSNRDNSEETEFKAGISLTYNLFRGGSDVATRKRSAYRVEQAKDIKEAAERQVKEGAIFAWNAYELIGQELTFLEQHVEQSYLTKVAYQEQFELGRRTLLDLLDTENELFEARKSHVVAETAYITSHYRLFNAGGKLLSGLRIKGSEYWGENGSD